MDVAGLSRRIERTLAFLVPTLPAATPLAQEKNTGVIDLSSAQNEVVWPELLEFYKSIVEEHATSKLFELPHSGLEGGSLQARDALATFFNRYFNPFHAVKPEHIVLTAGGGDAIESILHVVCNDGDSVIVPGPYEENLHRILKTRANVNPIIAQPPSYLHWDNYLFPSIQAVYDFSVNKSRIKAVLLCNPHNRLSGCYSRDALLDLMEFCHEHDLHLIVDEMYALASLDAGGKANRFVSALSLNEPFMPQGYVKLDPSRIHVVWSASKLFGLSGLRVGCLISQQNPQLLSATSLLTLHHTNNVAALYLSSLLSWSHLPTILKLNSERLTISCRLLAKALRSWDVDFITPTHGIFLFARLAKHARSAEEAKDFYQRLAVHGVRVAQGCSDPCVAGNFGWASVRFAVSVATMRDALEKIGLFLGQMECTVGDVRAGI